MKRRDKEQIKIYTVLVILIVLALYGLIRGTVDAVRWVRKTITLRPAEEVQADIILPSFGVGREDSTAVIVPQYGCEVAASEVGTMLRVWSEDDVPLPDWWDPDSAELVWEDHSGEVNIMVDDDHFTESGNMVAHPPEGIDPGGVDWNLCTTIWGWDGHGAEAWELDLFAKIFYREFWQPNLTLCEAGCDAMLGLWDLYGGTLFETLSHVNEDGSYTFSTYPGVWEIEYDPDGLAWCKAFCEERFYEGPVWPAQYFRKGHYHDWGEWSPIPAYEIDGIYFSIGKEQ